MEGPNHSGSQFEIWNVDSMTGPRGKKEVVASVLQHEWVRGHLADGFGVRMLCVRPWGLQRGLKIQFSALLLMGWVIPSPQSRDKFLGVKNLERIRGLVLRKLQRCVSSSTSRVQGVEAGET